MTALRAEAEFGSPEVPEKWVSIKAAAPVLVATMLAYLAQIAVSMRPGTVRSTEADLRIFAGFLIDHDLALSCVADIERSHVEAFKIWQRAQPGRNGKPIKETSFRRRMSLLKMFFIRIIEWEWDDAPARVPIFFGDVPQRDESLPKFLDDGDYTKFMRALADEPTVFRRLAVEMLARTGMRVGELCELEHDAVNIMGNEPWLRIPVGKLHNDRFIPLHPHLVDLIAEYQASDGPFTPGRLLCGAEGPLNRYAVDRWVKIDRPAGRDRPRPPPQTQAHARDPSRQSWHVDRSDRRPPRTPIVGHDHTPRQDLEQSRHRRIRRGRSQSRSALQHRSTARR